MILCVNNWSIHWDTFDLALIGGMEFIQIIPWSFACFLLMPLTIQWETVHMHMHAHMYTLHTHTQTHKQSAKQNKKDCVNNKCISLPLSNNSEYIIRSAFTTIYYINFDNETHTASNMNNWN